MIGKSKIAQFIGHRGAVYSLERGPGIETFFSSGGDGFVVHWSLANPEEGIPVAKVQGTVYAIQYLKDSNEILIASNKDGLHLIDLESKKEVWSYPTSENNWFRMALVLDKVWITGSDGKVIIFDTISRHIEVRKFGNHDLRSLDVNIEQRGLIIGNSNKEIFVINLVDNQVSILPDAHESSIFGIQIYPFENKFISVGKDAKIRLWALIDHRFWKIEQTVPAHLFSIHDVKLHPNKPIFATGSTDKTIKIWDAETLKLLRVLDKSRHAGHGHSINQLLWLENSEVLLSCSDDRTISAWNIFA